VLLLTSTSDKIQVISGQAVPVDIHASYIDYDGSVVTAGRLNSKPSTAVTTDAVPSPGSGVARNVKRLSVQNIHASSSVDITIQHTDGANVIQLEKVTLLAGEKIADVGKGFEVYDANGLIKTPVQTIAGSLIVAALGADQSNSTTTPTEVTGLSLPCGVGTWVFEYFLRLQSAAATTGHKLSVNHTGTVTSFMALLQWPTASDASGTALNAVDQDVVTANAGLMGMFAARAKSTAGWGTTLSVDTLAADVMYTIQGLVVVTVAGDIELWHGSEVAAASTVKAGSSLRLTKTG
jgi:hypothetical protein